MNLQHPAESLCLVHMAAEQAAGGSNEQLFLYIGLTSGVCDRVSWRSVYPALFLQVTSRLHFSGSKLYVRNLSLRQQHSKRGTIFTIDLTLLQVAVDATAGTLCDPRKRFLGTKPVKLFRIQVQGKRGVSSKRPSRLTRTVDDDRSGASLLLQTFG